MVNKIISLCIHLHVYIYIYIYLFTLIAMVIVVVVVIIDGIWGQMQVRRECHKRCHGGNGVNDVLFLRLPGTNRGAIFMVT